jgi:predicted oxidoreductase
VLAPFIKTVLEGVDTGLVELRFRHRVDELIRRDGAIVGVSGSILAPDEALRGEASNRDEIGEFTIEGASVVVASGGIGGNHELVRKAWPEWLGKPPKRMLSGVPAHVDGRMLAIAEEGGARLVNGDRMWHYVEGIENFDPIWPMHGIRILPGPSSLWFDATGKRLPVPLFPGFDTLGTLEYLRTTGYDHSWFILDQSIIEKEFALSGSEQNPDLTNKSVRELLRQRLGKGATEPVEAFKQKGADFVVADTLDDLFAGMRRLSPVVELDTVELRHQIEARDREMDHKFTKDAQITAIRGARNYLGDKLIRVAKPHKILDQAHFPLIAVKLHVVTRKSLGGIQTDLDSRALDAKGKPVPGLYAVGEAAGFGGGGVHGYRSLEGTFLGGCLFTGRQAGRAIAAL